MIGIFSLRWVWLGSAPAPVPRAEVAECSITHSAEMPRSSQAAGSVPSLCYCPRLDLEQTGRAVHIPAASHSPGAPQPSKFPEPKGPVPKTRHPWALSGFEELWWSQWRSDKIPPLQQGAQKLKFGVCCCIHNAQSFPTLASAGFLGNQECSKNYLMPVIFPSYPPLNSCRGFDQKPHISNTFCCISTYYSPSSQY